MTCSPARLAANRRNAQRSTGPKTEAGKAAARLNAFVHGLAGAGDLVAPDEDRDLIDRRELAFAVELKAGGAAGRLLARRAALLSVRMERAAERDRAATARARQAGREQFDRDRAEALAEIIAGVEAEADGPTVRELLVALEAAPDGVDYLLDAWEAMLADLDAGGDEQRSASVRRTMLWLNVPADAADAEDPPRLRERIAAEIKRLSWLGLRQAEAKRRLAAARDEAGLLASFDPSHAATLARRYEAAAERGVYRAFDGIARLNRGAGAEPSAGPARAAARFDLLMGDLAPAEEDLPDRSEAPAATPSAAASAVAAPPREAGDAGLGSFRAGPSVGSPPLADAILRPGPPALEPLPTRRQRPDLRKLAARR